MTSPSATFPDYNQPNNRQRPNDIHSEIVCSGIGVTVTPNWNI